MESRCFTLNELLAEQVAICKTLTHVYENSVKRGKLTPVAKEIKLNKAHAILRYLEDARNKEAAPGFFTRPANPSGNFPATDRLPYRD